MSFAQTFRRCDLSAEVYTGPTGYARPLVRSTGSELIADVLIAVAICT